ncbi:MAG: ATP-binding protein [Planctomycetes bacterium]|nr:ATP-binding protein [Planctomycetota bacterium]
MDWEKIIRSGFESKELDYKQACSWDENNRKACCALVKDILAMANTKGGRLVVGVSEGPKGFSYDGLTHEQAATFETSRVNRFLNRYADPPINTVVHRPELDGKTFVVIEVPVFHDTPHICQKDYTETLEAPCIYVRTDNNESAPLKTSADFRGIVEHAIRNRGDQLLTSFRAILMHGDRPREETGTELFQAQIKAGSKRCAELWPLAKRRYPYRETATFPAHFEPARFPLNMLYEMARRASVNFRGWPFLYINERNREMTYNIDDGVETYVPNVLHFWQLRQSGILYTQQEYREKSGDGTEPILDLDSFPQLACEAVYTLTRLYEGVMDGSDGVCLRFCLHQVQDVPFGSSNPYRALGRGYPPNPPACRIPSIRYEVSRALAEWRAGIIDHALDLCGHVFDRFNISDTGEWSGALPEARKLIEEMLAKRR